MFEFKRYPPLEKLVRAAEFTTAIETIFRQSSGVTWLAWSGNYLEMIGDSIGSILTAEEKAALGTVYLDLVPTVFEFNAITCEVKNGRLILLPQGILMLPLLNAYLYQALTVLEKLGVATNADWQTRFTANFALRMLGKSGSLKRVDPTARGLVRSCIKAVTEFDNILRIATLGTKSEVDKFPSRKLDPESWRFSDVVTDTQVRFVVSHEIAHLLAGDCDTKTASMASMIPGHQDLRVFRFSRHDQELNADSWAARAMRRDSSKRLIAVPINCLMFLIHCLDETTYFYQCKDAIRSKNPYPSRTTVDHPGAFLRRKGLAKAIGKFEGWESWDNVFDLVSMRQQGELELLRSKS
jgi:hypothetical protein